jgi:hypothetical protein
MLLIHVWRQHKETHPNFYSKREGEERGLREYNRGGELAQNTMYAYMEFSNETSLHY